MAMIDWKYLSRPLTVFTVTAAVAFTMLAGTNWFAANYKKKLDRVVKLNKSVLARTRSVLEQTALIKRYHKRFESLEQRGIIARERRLHWISRFREQAKSMKLRTARFRILRQSKSKYWSRAHPDVDVHSSVMKIRMHLLHEGDLVTMITALRQSSGLVAVNSCAMKRTQPTVYINPTASNLAIDCELEWFTLNPKRITGKKS